MNVVFADTLYYVAAVSPRDAYRTAARRFGLNYAGRFVTTEFSLLEVANFFSRVADRPVFLDLVRALKADPLTDLIPLSTELFARGQALFAARPDKEWSLTDCTSFCVMSERGIANALTADLHFAQAGFRPLLLPDADP